MTGWLVVLAVWGCLILAWGQRESRFARYAPRCDGMSCPPEGCMDPHCRVDEAWMDGDGPEVGVSQGPLPLVDAGLSLAAGRGVRGTLPREDTPAVTASTPFGGWR